MQWPCCHLDYVSAQISRTHFHFATLAQVSRGTALGSMVKQLLLLLGLWKLLNCQAERVAQTGYLHKQSVRRQTQRYSWTLVMPASSQLFRQGLGPVNEPSPTISKQSLGINWDRSDFQDAFLMKSSFYRDRRCSAKDVARLHQQAAEPAGTGTAALATSALVTAQIQEENIYCLCCPKVSSWLD